MKTKICFIALVIFFNISLLYGQKRNMSLVDILNIPKLSSVKISPDGNSILYLLAESDWKKNKQISHIYKINTDGTNRVKLTNGEKGEKNPIWSPDSEKIAFVARRSEFKTNQIYVINSSGGEANLLSNHETSVSSIRWSKGGKYIYFLASDPKSKIEKEKKKLKDDVYEFDNNYKQKHLWKISISDQIETKLTDGNFSINSYEFSKDGEYISIRKSNSPLREDADHSEIWIMNKSGGDLARITKNNVPESNPQISPDNNTILFLADANEKFEYYYEKNLFISNIDEISIKMLLPDFHHEILDSKWSTSGKFIFIHANLGVHTQLFKYDLSTNQLEQLTEGNHAIKSWQYLSSKNLHIFQLTNQNNPGDVWILDEKTSKKPYRVTNEYKYLAESFNIPKQEVVSWKGEDGTLVEGLLTYPINYEKGKKYPLNVQTHGGPRSSDKFGIWRWRTYIPFFASQGYFVLAPNYRGSTGYGDEFLRDMVGNYFNQSHLDVIAGAKHLVNQGLVDSTMMVKSGWSAGGHMTNKIITFTNIFKAASSGAGAFNWISMYGQSDTRKQRTDWFGGTPWEKEAPIDSYIKSSPLNEIWKANTPTIIFVGQEDPRVPMPQSVELYRGLKQNNVPTKLYIAPRAKHGWNELRHRLFKMNSEFEWFEKYARNKDFTWEIAPAN